jgi:hypothetical protein
MATQPELIIDNTAAAELTEREKRIEHAERNAYFVRGQELRGIRHLRSIARNAGS